MAVKNIKPSSSSLDFWGPLFEDEDGNLLSPGFVDYSENSANIWDKVYINIGNGFIKLPGIANVFFKRQKNKDKKKPVGVDSTTISTSGTKSAEIIIELLLWTPQHRQQMKQIIPVLFPKPGKDNGKQNSYQVKHPLFNDANIKAIVITGFEGPMHGHVSRSKLLRLECSEWMPTATTKKAGGTAPPPSLAEQTSTATLGLQSFQPQSFQPPGATMASNIDLNNQQSVP